MRCASSDARKSYRRTLSFVQVQNVGSETPAAAGNAVRALNKYLHSSFFISRSSDLLREPEAADGLG
jgi:hypothetical protein